jgi:RimJ/RimL family protein N-acetyltransferase
VSIKTYLSGSGLRALVTKPESMQSCVRFATRRPNPSLKLSPNGVAHWACGAGASPQFCAAVPARHTVGATLARTLGLTGTISLHMSTLHTSRLRLEPFAERHIEGLQAMNSCPEVMRYLGGEPEARQQTEAGVARVERCWAAWGTSWWAFLGATNGRVVGAGCIQYLRREAEPPEDLSSLVANPMEIGWRLHPDFWHQGFATEAAQAMATFAFGRFQISELLAVRKPDNIDSRRVMERLGMSFRGLESWYGTSVAAHVLSREEWQRGRAARSEA